MKNWRAKPHFQANLPISYGIAKTITPSNVILRESHYLREEVKMMRMKLITIVSGFLMFTGFVMVASVFAQSASPSATPSPSPSAAAVPSAAPSTGFGAISR